MGKRSVFTRLSLPALGAALVIGIASWTLPQLVQAVQPAEQAYDQYIGHFGAKNVKPPYIGEISSKYYDGSSDDLLTAGLGKTGLAAAAPTFAIPSSPTAAELRRNAIHTNYRAVLDITANGGYGTLYGPNVTNDGVVTASEGKIPGWEHIAYSDDGSGRKNVTLMVQVPDSFDVKRPCIVTATSSGSRGIYGAIGASGEWGLKQGCAVAYTDKGTGNGLHDLETNIVGLIDGTRTDAEKAGDDSIFTADITEAERDDFNDATPNRVAYKHAHSQQNPESDWGQNTLQAVRFAFFVLNETYGKKGPHGSTHVVLNPKNTIVIASGISNGGTGGLQAAEQDLCGLIDGVAVTEPNAQPADTRKLKIVQGTTIQPTIGKPLLDYFTVANLYQPCAALALLPTDTAGYSIVNLLYPSVITSGDERCASLAEKGLVSGATVAEQAQSALAKLRGYGWLADSDTLQLSHYAFASNAIAMTYSNAHGRVSVLDNLCGFSFANTNPAGDPIAQVPALQLGTFSTGNGVPPTTGVNIVYNLAENNSAGAVGKRDIFAQSPSTHRLDLALDGAVCHRNLIEGWDIVTGGSLSAADEDYSQRIQEGLDEVVLTARLRGKPAIIVHGRSDALVPVNHSSRAYYGTNQLVEGAGHRRLSYIEVTNTQHFDTFLGLPGYAERFIPLHVYLIRALNDMYDHLTAGKSLPPSQVVRTKPRGSAENNLKLENVPPIKKYPAFRDRIWFIKNTLYIPD
jgi:hydroxybutyrate-dimer hydrolase